MPTSAEVFPSPISRTEMSIQTLIHSVPWCYLVRVAPLLGIDPSGGCVSLDRLGFVIGCCIFRLYVVVVVVRTVCARTLIVVSSLHTLWLSAVYCIQV
jgi:hypothetical protein